MRFIKTQIIKTKVVDQEIVDPKNVEELFQTLQKSSVYITMEYRDARTKHVRTNEQVRVKEVKDGAVTIAVYSRQGSMIVRGIKYEDVISIHLSSELHNIELGKEVSRFDFLEI
jgi:glycerol-3-phosphate dehydrogenase